ncbi:ATP-dependent DNA helicase [Spiroplasma helicoides]|uniref:DNA 3'-5' helicase n=1 Tax=Spiroplasma helicoides TaxID=216938 RepID=A0A1B3SJG1_9MOLU|nr:UvrD-helicase domain-containing protein [Spiroplasma helicoides]AOG60061.1 ATP-dependent DNA helicase [Spiroplasma helicoides]
MAEFLKNLNEQQLDSVITTDVPLRIIAGAGSGKTRVITTKIAYLIEKENILPNKILAVTFTNKAANEMKERILKLSNNLYKVNHIMTFHSFCVRILREEFELLNLKQNFTIIDTSEQTRIIRRILKSLDIVDQKSKPEKKIISKISRWKNSLTDWEEAYESSFNNQDKQFAKVYRDYQQYLLENHLLDFDDLLLKAHTLFKNNLEVRQKWANRFSYILVDEFQDTNYIQFDLVKWITNGRGCLTVVGDPDQTIYSWRGAKVNIILNFEKEFKNARTVQLNQNYRSTKPILDLANSFIDNNKNREKKDIFTNKKEGTIVAVKECASRNFEAKYVAKKIKELVEEKKYKYSDFYVLYRTNAWSFEFEKEFSNSKIPFQLVGGFEFRERKIIKDITALLKVVCFQDELSFERVFSFVQKVGPVTAQKLIDCARRNDLSLFDLITQRQDLLITISKNLNSLANALNEGYKLFMNNERVLDICKKLVNLSGYKEILDLKSKEDQEALQNLEAYYDQMAQFDKDYEQEASRVNRLTKFLQEETLSINSDGNIEVPNKVTLLTIHSAKGLENKVVFIVGVNKDVFPSRMSLSSIEALEEERRALYVAITRAQELLYISYVVGEYSYISSGELGASRFITELDPELYELEKNIFFHNPTDMTSQKVYFEKKENIKLNHDVAVSKGDVIEHMMFGEGIVDKVMDKYIQIAFINPAFGVKAIPINSNSWKKK